jgi:hypothetical protein
MEIDHIFIFTKEGLETDKLIEFGLTEGSGRKHKGIGTQNRRIFFNNFYIEILWVSNENEAKKNQNLGIWNRYDFKNTNYSRFAICLKNTKDTDSIFKNAIKWKPDFLSNDQFVEILTNETMPWIFRFPLNRNKYLSENTNHKSGLQSLSKATLHLKNMDFGKEISMMERNSNIEFVKSKKELLVLEFDNRIQGKSEIFKELNLEIHF